MFLAEDGRPIGLSWNYTRKELMADAAIHIAGIVFGVAGAIAIVILAAMAPLDWTERAGVVVYAAALVSMLGVSATYNMCPVGRRKWILRRADHAIIYLMIAGTYTPLVALVGRGSTAWFLLAFIWVLAGIGIALKLLLPGRFDRAAIGLYLLLGWSGVATYESVIGALKPEAFWLLAIGGVLYSLGIIFHVWRSLPYQNAIWHAFVLAATACHYGTVLTSVIDTGL